MLRRSASALVCSLLVAAASALGAQRPRADSGRVERTDTTRADSLRAELDSLRARLARAEAAVALVRQQLATESESAVRTQSRVAVDLFARVLMNAAWTRGATNDAAVPQAVQSTGEDARAFTFTPRQTRVGGAVTVRDVVGATFDGDVDLDFYGGGRDASGNRPLFPEPRLRTVRGTLRWARTAVMVGSDTPLISDLDPFSLASVGVTEFSGAGDLWNWLAQLRVTQLLGGRRVRWAVQGAVLEPFANAAFDPARPGGGDGGERSGLPFVESRLRARWGPEDGDAPGAALLDARDAIVGEGPSEVGVSVHRGWVRTTDSTRYASSAVAVDVRLVLAPRVELRGEAYRGRLLFGLGGGAIGQAFGRPAGAGVFGAPLRDTAAWAQLNVRPSESWLGGVGCGIDRVDDSDRPERRQNTACAAHVRWTPVQPVLLGLEYRRLATLYSTGMFRADHVNLAIGFTL